MAGPTTPTAPAVCPHCGPDCSSLTHPMDGSCPEGATVCRCPECYPAPPELDFCSRCHEHAEFGLLDGEWLSLCCSARPVSPDVEAP